MRTIYTLLLFGSALAAQPDADIISDYLSRKDHLAAHHIETSDDKYLEGYIQSLLNSHYYELDIIVQVLNGKAYLYNVPDNEMLEKSILSFVGDVPGILSVEAPSGPPPAQLQKRELVESDPIGGIWFPQTTVLFPPLIADPREPQFYLEYRWGDATLGTSAVAVALGDTFPIYRWIHVMGVAAVQVGIQAGAWTVFNMAEEGIVNDWAQIVNTDFLVGIPVTVAFDGWSFRGRIYHVSTHLGDEYIEDNPGVQRKNPSYEAIDIYTQYQISDGIRVYFGPGALVRDDETYPMGTMYVEYGTEMRAFGEKLFNHKLYGTPFLALNFRNWQTANWRLDFTGMLGYEFSKLQGVGRKFRAYLKYHNGYSDGQFFKEYSQFGALGISWGF